MLARNFICNVKAECRRQGVLQKDLLPHARATRLFHRLGQGQSVTVDTLARVAGSLDVSVKHLLADYVERAPAPEKNRRTRVALGAVDGTGIEKAVALWVQHKGHITPEFAAAWDRQGFWEISQIYKWHEGRFTYLYVGPFFLRTLGTWALTASGKIVGRHDPDPVYAEWTMEIWQQVMTEWKPLSFVCLVNSAYGGPPVLHYRAAYLPVTIDGEAGLLMVARCIDGEVDSEAWLLK